MGFCPPQIDWKLREKRMQIVYDIAWIFGFPPMCTDQEIQAVQRGM
jgi:hypothetical protein